MNLIFNMLTLAAEGAPDPVDHVVDKPLGSYLGLGDHWMVSNVTIMLVVGGIVTLAVLLPAAKNIMTGPNKTIDDYRAKGLLANFVEVVSLYLRDSIFKPALLDQTDKYTPFLWTLFWYILVLNLLGLMPIADFLSLVGVIIGHPIGPHGHGIGGTATQSIWVTAALAVISFLVINVSGLIKDTKGYFTHLTGGAPAAMWPIMIPVEILGIFIKPFALAMRLFANMTGGHLVIAVLLSFVYGLISHFGGLYGAGGKALGGGFALLPLLGVVGIYFLELLVAFIQAFVFSFLTCLFLSQLVVHAHHEEHHADHSHGHDHGHDHKPGHAH